MLDIHYWSTDKTDDIMEINYTSNWTDTPQGITQAIKEMTTIKRALILVFLVILTFALEISTDVFWVVSDCDVVLYQSRFILTILFKSERWMKYTHIILHIRMFHCGKFVSCNQDNMESNFDIFYIYYSLWNFWNLSGVQFPNFTVRRVFSQIPKSSRLLSLSLGGSLDLSTSFSRECDLFLSTILIEI